MNTIDEEYRTHAPIGRVFLIMLGLVGLSYFISRFDKVPPKEQPPKKSRYHVIVPDTLKYQGMYYAHMMHDTITIDTFMVTDYGLSWEDDSVTIWDNDRPVGKVRIRDTALDTLLINDND